MEGTTAVSTSSSPSSSSAAIFDNSQSTSGDGPSRFLSVTSVVEERESEAAIDESPENVSHQTSTSYNVVPVMECRVGASSQPPVDLPSYDTLSCVNVIMTFWFFVHKKHRPPSLSDEVWRLKKMGKHEAFHERLSTANVNTVKDFLTLLHLDSERLRNPGVRHVCKKLGCHSRACSYMCSRERVYLYCSPNCQHKSGVVFNLLGQVMGLYSESNYVSINKMSENDKINAQEIVRESYPNWDAVISFEDLNSLLCFSLDERKSLTLQKTDLLNDCVEPNIPSPTSMFSRGYVSNAEDFSLEDVDSNLDLGFDDPLDSLLLDMDNDNQHLGFLDVDCYFQATNPSLESNPHSPALKQTVERLEDDISCKC